ncbi:MAG: hypothetical protein ACOCTI_02155 [Phycisphaeraceae bacterium]
MQRQIPEGIVISCDFCGTDWDQQLAMIEGHQGSVICLDCFKKALAGASSADDAFDCTICLQHREPPTRVWRHPGPEPSPGLNPGAAICWPCVRLAAKTFHKDADTDFRWNPAEHPGE